MPRVSHVLETSLYVADLDVAQTFYERVFGFEPFLRDHRMRALGVPGAGVLLLFQRGGSATPSPTPGGIIPAHDASGQQHLAFAIPRGELQVWIRHLEAENVILESTVVWPAGGTSVYFRDPDGHSLEVAVPGLWPSY